jgi:flagellar protein FlaG
MSDTPVSPVGTGKSRGVKQSGGQVSQESKGETRQQGGPADNQSSERKEGPASEEKVRETAEQLNKTSEMLNRDLRFNVLPEDDVVQAEIVNQETDEVIRKIPPDELLEIRKTLDEFLGMLVDETR